MPLFGNMKIDEAVLCLFLFWLNSKQFGIVKFPCNVWQVGHLRVIIITPTSSLDAVSWYCCHLYGGAIFIGDVNSNHTWFYHFYEGKARPNGPSLHLGDWSSSIQGEDVSKSPHQASDFSYIGSPTLCVSAASFGHTLQWSLAGYLHQLRRGLRMFTLNCWEVYLI